MYKCETTSYNGFCFSQNDFSLPYLIKDVIKISDATSMTTVSMGGCINDISNCNSSCYSNSSTYSTMVNEYKFTDITGSL